MAASAQSVEISFALPKAPHAILHGHLTFLEACAMIHLTTSELGADGSSATPLGSFVYAMPDVSRYQWMKSEESLLTASIAIE